jgi:hypothetical protein
MSKSKVTIFTRKKNLTDNNRMWYERYIENIRAEGKSKESIEAYSNIIINLLEVDIDKDINKVNIDSIAKFIYQTDKGTRVNFKIGRIQDFLQFVGQDVELKIKPADLETFKLKAEEIQMNKRIAEALNIKEIIKIRNILKNDLNRLFVFEMVYQHGVTLDELEESIRENYDYDTKTFDYSSRSVKVSKKISDIISLKSKVLNHKTRTAYSNNISGIGDLINRKLIWSDIIETRKEYFFKCSLCNNQYENIPDNWALLHYENDVDNVKWIVCRECALKGGYNG